ncbi:MAG: His-Xaa-Ser repeat protein HxsA2 [Porticoccaceae bacterium]
MDNTKRKFLLPFAAVAAAFSAEQALASVAPSEPLNETTREIFAGQVQDTANLAPQGEDLMRFVLKRNSEGVLMAEHESHASHASHTSHRSHTSGY